MKNKIIAVIGLGYVGLPLAVEFGKNREVIGYDSNKKRIRELNNNEDKTLECNKEELSKAKYLKYTSDKNELEKAKIFIITVPTPIDEVNRPKLDHLINASETVAEYLTKESMVIYESTVYPGATEEVCVPILEKISGLKYNKDFYCGYSPERINPGDKKHRIVDIKKITSGSTPKAAQIVNDLYLEIIKAGTYRAKSIKIAEAAKVIENTQRDLNIALMNELSILFEKLGIDTLEVLEAAETKWNFLKFKPGLVGGHCIGVDPYYLTHKAQEVNYHPEVILAGRRINDSIPMHIAQETIKLMIGKKINIGTSRILIMGLTFKENCTDIRNSKVVEIIKYLENYKISVDVYDPWVNIEDAYKEYKIKCLENKPQNNKYDAIIIAVKHEQFFIMGGEDIRKFGKRNTVIYDVKGMLPKHLSDKRL